MSFFDAMAADDVTLHGLEKWTCHLYEQLGWMSLAYKSKNEDKVGSYLISIKKLQKSIQSRLKIIISEDAKLDLQNLLSKVEHLLKVTSKLFSKEHIRKTICNKCALPVESNETDETDETKQEGGSKSRNKSKSKISKSNISKSNISKSNISKSNISKSNISKSNISKLMHLNELSKLSKKLSKKSSKTQPKKLSKTQPKKSSKTQLKKSSKTQPKKSSKTQSKKNMKELNGGNYNVYEPLIKKLSKKSSKKHFKKISN
jgi:hypothetical protein